MARDPEGRRLRILEAACALIAESGVGALTHRAVAARAEVPVGATTYYFTTLDELSTAALTHAATRSAEVIHTWRAAITTAADLPATLADLIADYAADHRPWTLIEHELHTAATHRPELRPLARTRADATLDALSTRVPADRARAATVFLDGLMLHTLVHGEPVDRPFVTDALRRLLGG